MRLTISAVIETENEATSEDDIAMMLRIEEAVENTLEQLHDVSSVEYVEVQA